ncbi:glycoside hydrolase family 16 protein [bacterium]|nr:glycoside hydrolase family 16 protein [bacterium]
MKRRVVTIMSITLFVLLAVASCTDILTPEEEETDCYYNLLYLIPQEYTNNWSNNTFGIEIGDSPGKTISDNVYMNDKGEYAILLDRCGRGGCICTRDRYGYGRFEGKIKVVDVHDNATIAFYTYYDRDRTNEEIDEIDIEYYPHLHKIDLIGRTKVEPGTGAPCPEPRCQKVEPITDQMPNQNEYYTWSIDWQKDRITFSIYNDESVVFEKTISEHVPDDESYFMVSIWTKETEVEGGLIFFKDFKYTPDSEPDTYIVSGPNGEIQTQSVRFEWGGSDNGEIKGYYYGMDDPDPSFWTTSNSMNFIDLSYGEHTFYVKAEDNCGNVDSTPVFRKFTVVPPDANNDPYIDTRNIQVGKYVVNIEKVKHYSNYLHFHKILIDDSSDLQKGKLKIWVYSTVKTKLLYGKTYINDSDSDKIYLLSDYEDGYLDIDAFSNDGYWYFTFGTIDNGDSENHAKIYLKTKDENGNKIDIGYIYLRLRRRNLP